MRRILGLALVLMWLAACVKPTDQSAVEPGNGRLVRWSDQTADSPKKIIFIPGCVTTTDPHGLNPAELEDYFSIKTGNFEQLGPEMFGAKVSALAEYWFYGYYPNQDIAKIADDLSRTIAGNRNFGDNCAIAVVAHSEGAVVGWLLDQRYQNVAGGALLGGPILSTPIAHKNVRDQAVEKTFPVLYAKLIPLFDRLAVGTEQLAVSYPESKTPHSRLKFFVGRIATPSVSFWERNINLVDALLAERGFMGGIQDNRQFAELGATLIAQSAWGSDSKMDRRSDGLVPVSSGILNGQVPFYQILDGYDHWDLVSGKGDLALDRLTLEWLDQVLRLRSNWVETDLPATPDIIELPNDGNGALAWARFAYINPDGQLTLADENWERSYTLSIAGVHGHPQFDDTGESLAFDVDDDGVSNIYVWSGVAAHQISFDGQSRCPAWSPNDRWLTYQSASNLLVHRLANDDRAVVATDITLIAPPVWTVDQLLGRLYIVDSSNELRWVSPRERNAAATNLIQSNCSRPFLVKGPIGGMIVIGLGSAVDSQRITVVTGLLAKHLSVEVRYDPAQWNIEQNDTDVVLTLDRQFNFSEAAYDPVYNHLYLVGEWDRVSGIYLLDIQSFLDCTKAEPDLSEFFWLTKEGASQLAIKPSR